VTQSTLGGRRIELVDRDSRGAHGRCSYTVCDLMRSSVVRTSVARYRVTRRRKQSFEPERPFVGCVGSRCPERGHASSVMMMIDPRDSSIGSLRYTRASAAFFAPGATR
jgi:hypothetical protein